MDGRTSFFLSGHYMETLGRLAVPWKQKRRGFKRAASTSSGEEKKESVFFPPGRSSASSCHTLGTPTGIKSSLPYPCSHWAGEAHTASISEDYLASDLAMLASCELADGH